MAFQRDHKPLAKAFIKGYFRHGLGGGGHRNCAMSRNGSFRTAWAPALCQALCRALQSVDDSKTLLLSLPQDQPSEMRRPVVEREKNKAIATTYSNGFQSSVGKG